MQATFTHLRVFDYFSIPLTHKKIFIKILPLCFFGDKKIVWVVNAVTKLSSVFYVDIHTIGRLNAFFYNRK